MESIYFSATDDADYEDVIDSQESSEISASQGGEEAHESSDNNASEDNEPITVNNPLDSEQIMENPSLGGNAQRHPVFLIAEIHNDPGFTGLQRDLENLATLEQVLLGMEGEVHYREVNAVPNRVEGHPHFGLEDPIIRTINDLSMLRAMLKDTRLSGETLNLALSLFGSLVDGIVSGCNTELIEGIANLHELQDNALSAWIFRNKQKILKKKSYQERCITIINAWKKAIIARTPVALGAIEGFLTAAINQMLVIQGSSLNPYRTIDFQELETLIRSFENLSDWNQVMMSMVEIRSKAMAENIIKLHAYAESLDRPLFVICGALHAESLENYLQNASIKVSLLSDYKKILGADT